LIPWLDGQLGSGKSHAGQGSDHCISVKTIKPSKADGSFTEDKITARTDSHWAADTRQICAGHRKLFRTQSEHLGQAGEPCRQILIRSKRSQLRSDGAWWSIHCFEQPQLKVGESVRPRCFVCASKYTQRDLCITCINRQYSTTLATTFAS